MVRTLIFAIALFAVSVGMSTAHADPPTVQASAYQDNLTLEEQKVLDDIAEAKENGTYIRPPEQEPEETTSAITDPSNPLCKVIHYDERLKELYGCH